MWGQERGQPCGNRVGVWGGAEVSVLCCVVLMDWSGAAAIMFFCVAVQPLRVNGVKVYTENVDKRQIIMDLQIT